MQLPLNVSPVSASFIGFQRPGIHPVLFIACMEYDGTQAALHLPRRSFFLHTVYFAFLCFLSCLGKIEVIMLIQFLKVHVVENPDNWKVENRSRRRLT